jgi:ATP-dependent helicase Lhr and Lhr-like helicase
VNSLDLFHPIISKWFTEQVGQPTDVQAQAWPRIANREHVLITAPTGSGKTLTAFLWAINQLLTGKWTTGHTSVLYVSPLKALNNDIRRNLITPLDELKKAFEQAGIDFPDIRVLTRSGDTPQSDRMRMQRHPPEILITTPESLNLILSSPNARSMLRDLSTVILDEIHGVINTKRGTHLITAVDRLVPLCGEFQRISLSATIKPLKTVANFVGGLTIDGSSHNPRYTERPVSIIKSEANKQYDVHVRFPEEALDWHTHESLWDPLVEDFKRIVGQNRSTLFFTNGRRLCEKMTHKINDGEDHTIAYSHHGSLSREIRSEVEQKLKAGDLKAIIATNSLEMGIDIGALDEVVLIQSPPSVSSAIQRVGRAGHRVGEVSRGTIFPTHDQDFLQAAVLTAGILKSDIEDIKPVECPLDVLAQVIVSMVGVETWDIDVLYTQLKTSYPYRNLNQKQFDLILNMLGGRYADSRIRELKPKISIDRIDNTVESRKGALLAVYMSGGMIPNRGYFHLRHNESGALIGELDEEFVWEASVGQIFTLGAQNWKIERITHNDVFVAPSNPKALAPPFWIGEEQNRDFHFSERIAEFLETANESMDSPEYFGMLKRDHCMNDPAAKQLIEFLKRQKEETNCDLPHRNHLLLEWVSAGPGGFPGNQLVLHTLWGGSVNRPYAMALEAAWEEQFRQKLEVYTSDDSIVLQLPNDVRGDEVLSLVTSTSMETLLRKRLEGSGYFGARFRECAGRALLLTRNKVSERMPLWMSRLRSQKLMDTVMKYEDFPILLEAWRTCLQDEFDIESLRAVLAELESGVIGWSETHTSHPSPMAQSSAWRQITEYMYRTDEPNGVKTSSLRSDLLRDVVFTPALRPTISIELIKQFELKRQRLAAGYSPETSRELLDWAKERLMIPLTEWESLLHAMRQDHGIEITELLKLIKEKLVRISPPRASDPIIVALEMLPRILYALWPEHVSLRDGEANAAISSKENDILCLNDTVPDITEYETEEPRDEVLTSILGEWLQFCGPTTPEYISTTLGTEPGRLQLALEDLIDSEAIIIGQLTTGETDEEICDSENFEILLRIARADAIPSFEPVNIDWLPLYLATYQKLTNPSNDIDQLFGCLEQLVCYPAEAGKWESEILPARAHPYSISMLDTIMQEGDLKWIGSENRRVAFCFESDLDLMQEMTAPSEPEQTNRAAHLFPDPTGRYDFSTLMRTSNMNPSELSDRLWEAVWQSRVTNDTFAALRKGIENRFKVAKSGLSEARSRSKTRRPGSRTGFARWKGSVPFAGNWYKLPTLETSEDLIEIEERKKDRARILFDRYGILFRELLANESPPFKWANVFRSLRLMELSGEIMAGYFFEGIPGPQFISHQAFRILQRKLPENAIYWINATDPVSLCGIQIDAIKGPLPKRVPGNHLVCRGKDLVLISQRNGKSLTINIDPDDPNLTECFGFLRHMQNRQFQPIRRITIETINGEEAAGSSYVDALRTSFEVLLEHKSVILYSSPTNR